MKLIHISDLHLGKRVNEFSMLEEQEHILNKIADIAAAEKPCILAIAGDIYDKSVPPAEAVSIFDDFLCRLSDENIPVYAISGNHDSAERIAFGSKLMDGAGIHFSPVYKGSCTPYTEEDEFGRVNIYLLPFVRPANVRAAFPEADINSYDDAVRLAVKAMNVDTSQRNIILSHQFVTGALRSDSESVSVGGLDDIGADIFADFDYAALGHIHGAQSISREAVRYCGTPLKYSFSEAASPRTLTIAELKEKGSVSVRTEVLEPLHDMREIRGTYMEVTARSFYTDKNRFDYIHCTLTDEQEIPEAMGKLRAVYPNIMKLDYDNLRSKAAEGLPETINISGKTPTELFGEFYERCNNSPMSSEQAEYISGAVAELWGSY